MIIARMDSMSLTWPQTIRESPEQFENRIKPWVYVRCVTRRTMFEKATFY